MNENKTNINWFPGHMKKTLEEMEKNIKKVDVVLYVLDSRAVLSCFNPKLDQIASGKPVIFILSKKDMSDVNVTNEWKKYFEEKGNQVLALNSTLSNIKKDVVAKIKEVLKDKILKNQERGVNVIYRAMVVGVPNSGKSTLINAMLGKSRAITGDKPGVTKSTLWVKLADNIEMMDTPGTLWPNLTNHIAAENLALIGSIKQQILDEEALACVLIDRLKELCSDKLMSRYKLESIEQDNYEVLKNISRNMGAITRGGEVDVSRGAKMVLDDFRRVKIGKISLDQRNKIFNGNCR